MRGEVSTNIIYCELQKKTDMLHELYPIELKKKVQKNLKKIFGNTTREKILL